MQAKHTSQTSHQPSQQQMSTISFISNCFVTVNPRMVFRLYSGMTSMDGRIMRNETDDIEDFTYGNHDVYYRL
jgi:hypothetical protein